MLWRQPADALRACGWMRKGTSRTAKSSAREVWAKAPGRTASRSTAYGNLWGTMVYSDKLFVLTPRRRPADSSR